MPDKKRFHRFHRFRASRGLENCKPYRVHRVFGKKLKTLWKRWRGESSKRFENGLADQIENVLKTEKKEKRENALQTATLTQTSKKRFENGEAAKKNVVQTVQQARKNALKRKKRKIKNKTAFASRGKRKRIENGRPDKKNAAKPRALEKKTVWIR